MLMRKVCSEKNHSDQNQGKERQPSPGGPERRRGGEQDREMQCTSEFPIRSFRCSYQIVEKEKPGGGRKEIREAGDDLQGTFLIFGRTKEKRQVSTLSPRGRGLMAIYILPPTRHKNWKKLP